MSPFLSGSLLMLVGAFCLGGTISLRQQKVPLVVQVAMLCVALLFIGYGGYVLFAYN
ncbi:hypothetical protein ACN08Z_03640 [Rothia sp. P7181]|uniref:hypothetical protein n=1 Tax=unclassified Rothia (in: high G+C Gram-positive bacteria) TaxID=2689056 RepID=UPI003ABF0CCE